MSRQIAVQLATLDERAVALPALVRTLGALQKVLLQIGEMHYAGRRQTEEQVLRPRGRFANVIQEACEFQVIGLSVGSATAVLELAPQEPTLPLTEHQDLGMQALETIRRLAQRLQDEGSWEDVRELLPLDAYRSRILSTYRDLCPAPGEKTIVRLSDPQTPGHAYDLSTHARARVCALRAQASPADVIRERCLIGHIRVLQARPFACTLVLEDSRSLTMPFDEDQADEYRYLWDQRVIARTMCRVIARDDEDDTIAEIREVVEIEPIDDQPLKVDAISLATGALPLRQPLTVTPTFADNLVTFEYPQLGILAYGETREEARQAFEAELAWLWSFYADAPDARLAKDAMRLREHLHHMVDGAAA